MRIRSVKPEFWRSPDISELRIEDRLLFIGLWSYVDDNGVGQDRVSTICADLFADDLSRDPRETLARVSEGLRRLSEAGRIVRYTVEKRDYLAVDNWAKHQRIDKPNKARYPGPTRDDAQIRETLAESSRDIREIPLPGTEEQGNRGTGEQSGPATAGSTKRPRRPIPDDWQPTDRHVDYANERNLDLDREADAYRAHAQANDRRLVDWDAGFRQWLTNAKPRSQARPSGRVEPRTFGQMKHDNNLELWAQVKAEEEGQDSWPRQLGA